MIPFIRRKMNPASYQGQHRRSPHFEGWYYKLVDKDERRAFAVIPGVFVGKNRAENHAFIQVLDGNRRQVHYIRYPLEVFASTDGRFDVQIGPNAFSADGLRVDIRSEGLSMRGELRFSSLVHWPVSFFSPGIMGWYAWVPFMECYHGIISLSHGISGTLCINGIEINFSGGKGYIEKDWGRSFPEAWVWFQSNHFEDAGTSLTASLAVIPWIHQPFLGFIVGLWHRNRLYRFATYTGAKTTRLHIDESGVQWTIHQKEWTLDLHAFSSEGGWLQAPRNEGMVNRIPESLDSSVEIALTLEGPSKREVCFQGKGRRAGYEAAGNLERLLDMAGHQWNLEKRR